MTHDATTPEAPTPRSTALLDVLAGLVTGLIVVVSSVSYAALISHGPLAPMSSRIASSALLGAALMALVVGRRSAIAGVVAGPQSAAAAVLASMAAVMPPAAPREVLAASLLAAVVGAPLLTGLWFILIGRAGWGRLIRFIPYPVIGGFMAGTGFLLVRGAIDLLAGEGAVRRLLDPHTLLLCGPGIALALALLIVPRWLRHPLAVPGLLFCVTLLFWGIGLLVAPDIGALRAAGWLLTLPAGDGGLALLTPMHLFGAEPRILAQMMGGIATIGLVSAISLLLNCTALELTLARDIQLDRELETAGWGNLASAAVGGLVGFPYLGTSLVARRMGAVGTWTGVTTAAVCLAVVVAGPGMLEFFPRFVLGGLVLYLGLDLLLDWAIRSQRRLPLVDYAIVLFILVIVGAVGFLQGVFVGCLLAAVLFAISYSQADVVRYQFTGKSYRSSVDRHPDQLRILQKQGDRIQVVVLQGFLFFGTAHSLVDLVKRQLSGGKVGWLVLDLRLVTDIDSSVASGFIRLHQACEGVGIRLVLSDVPKIVYNRLIRGGFALARSGEVGVRAFDELDQAVEWCEEQLLEDADPSLPGVPPPSDLLRIFQDPDALRRLLTYADIITLEPRAMLVREGEVPDAIYYLDSGRLRVTVLSPSGRRSRLRTLRAGSMVGEIGYFLGQPRVATVEAEEPCRVVRLGRAQVERMLREDPALSATLYAWVVHELAERLAQTNELLKVTMR